MLASFALLQTLIRRAHDGMAEALLQSPERVLGPSVRPQNETSPIEEQRELEMWLFDRDSRWER